ncbi:MAG: DNA polymerase/3'-5' exonuclease PolX [Alphaproteobacteria bacterium]|nr:DNA polymerase/3'-5' exonuclease PolX [Alphaproteobacteria bacterium]
MAVHNADIASMFNRTADLLELQGANPFRIRAYRRAARTIADLPQSAARLVKSGADLSELPGIGDDLAGKIAGIVKTGRCPILGQLEKEFPAGLTELLNVGGLGPKRVMALHQSLGIDNIDDLRRAIRAGKIRTLKGFSEKIEQKILHALETRGTQEKRFKWIVADETARPLAAWLSAIEGVKKVVVAGSYRRMKDTVGDLDILVTCAKGSPVIDRFVKHEEVAEIVSRGATRATVLLRSGLQVDLRAVPDISYGAALYYFTGSKAHNVAVRALAVKRGLKINEYGVFKGDKRLAGRTEEEVFRQVGLPYIEPELRENRGEIEAARAGTLPRLVTVEDMRGDLHAHTKASDGRNSLSEMAAAARALGYEYLAITDHSRHLTIANGLDEKRLRKQCEDIDRLNDKLKGITLLKSCEVDILESGKLDLPDSILKELDLAVCSVHYKFDLPAARQTERIIRAMDNPYFNILAHPTGRLIGEREPYALEMERIVRAAKERGCLMEINAQPDRLDLNDIHCRMAKDAGVKLAISTDAHATGHLRYMTLGVAQARRGWLEAKDVVNTLALKALRQALKRK